MEKQFVCNINFKGENVNIVFNENLRKISGMEYKFNDNEDDGTPSLAISLNKDYRGQGIGTALMKTMIEELKESGYKQTSLAVQKANYAVNMYKSVGFETVDENQEEYIMVCKLSD